LHLSHHNNLTINFKINGCMYKPFTEISARECMQLFVLTDGDGRDDAAIYEPACLPWEITMGNDAG
jgi:hypothetical protein